VLLFVALLELNAIARYAIRRTTMTNFRFKGAGIFTTLTAFAASTVSAQSTNCMAMGPDMVQCYDANGSNTNCIAMGSDMAHCETIGGTRSTTPGANGGRDSGSGGGFLDNILGMNFQESSFRKKVGRMIAAGDCEGAARMAYEKGRLELGADISRTCKPAAR
jgi:hypothetical protein